MLRARQRNLIVVLMMGVLAVPVVGQVLQPATSSDFGTVGDDSIAANQPVRLRYIFGANNASAIDRELFTGSYTAPLDGTITLLINDPDVVIPAAVGYIGISVKEAVLLASDWTPPLAYGPPDPWVLMLDPTQPSHGWYHPRTRTIYFALHLVNGCFQPAATMPIYFRGKITRQRLNVTGCNQNVADDGFCATIGARRYNVRPDIRYSTEVGFDAAADNTGSTTRHISDGDLLSENICVAKSNHDLTARLGIMPPTPDLGLDAVTLTEFSPILFSIEQSIFSERLGPISDGDLLSIRGAIIRHNAELIAPFGPMPGIGNYGLDAVHVKTTLAPLSNALYCCGDILFSIERSFWSESQARSIGHGDLLCDDGAVIRTNQQLLGNFHPIAVACPEAGCPQPEIPCTSASNDERCRDLGLDGVFVTPEGEILFSVERGFRDANLGWVSDGDVLSDRGTILRTNAELVDGCYPISAVPDFGLDALDFVGNGNASPAADLGSAPVAATR
jgi:hypothetical protein